MLVRPCYAVKCSKIRSLRSVLPRPDEVFNGFALGTVMSAIILSAHHYIGPSVYDIYSIRETACSAGLCSHFTFAVWAVYFVIFNSFAEEYIWRWYVFVNCREMFVHPVLSTIVASMLFTLHHVILLIAFSESIVLVACGSAAVFLAGLAWSRIYVRWKSLWGCYVSHALVDLAIALVVADIFFAVKE